MMKASLAIDGSHAHDKTMKAISSLVNVDSNEQTKNLRGFFSRTNIQV
jgi:hypothetical protein